MSLHYFNALPKDNKLDDIKNLGVSKAIKIRAYESLTPFYQYLETAITAFKKKGEIKVEWHRYDDINKVELVPEAKLWRLPFKTTIKLVQQTGKYKIDNYDELNPEEFDFSEVLKFKVGGKKGKCVLSPCDISSDGFITLPDVTHTHFDKVLWDLDELRLSPCWSNPEDASIVTVNGRQIKFNIIDDSTLELTTHVDPDSQINIDGVNVKYDIESELDVPDDMEIFSDNDQSLIVISKKKPAQTAHEEKFNKNIFDTIKLVFVDNQNAFEGKFLDKRIFTVNDVEKVAGRSLVSKTNKLLRFEIKEAKVKDEGWIQLEEPEDDDKSVNGLSPIRYFFDDGVEVRDESNNRYRISKGREEEARLILVRSHGTQNGKKFQKVPHRKQSAYDYPPDNDKLKVSINTYQLEKQRDALRTLQNMPIDNQSKLIKLFEDKDKVFWQDFTPQKVDCWHVLTEENRDGCKDQRCFVENALACPDFMLLEGPPGSGKTTAILELICQAIKQNQRVLLCGSTHVAIDNVLERLNDPSDGKDNLIDSLGILPIRIGEKNRISDEVEIFQLGEQVRNSEIEEILLLDSANLVCGTTMGILQHPRFKKRRLSFKKPEAACPVMPEFDMLIIDESSKTTFHEFLVPALYAKKWILAGDIMQLSPFTDRDELVAAFEFLPIDRDRVLPYSYQYISFVLQKIESHLDIVNSIPLAVLIKSEHIETLLGELQNRLTEKMVGLVCDRPQKNNDKIRIFSTDAALLETVAADILFIDENCWTKIENRLPECFMILENKLWKQDRDCSCHSFRHNYWDQKYGDNPYIKDRGKEIRGTFSISDFFNKYFSEESWADQIAWRIDREHTLRLTNSGKSDGYSRTIAELLPTSLDKNNINNRINTQACVALPSILECLVRGIKRRKSQNESTISEGFNEKELSKRRVTLKFQHRMHPEISSFPREQYYSGKIEGLNGLYDLKKPTPISELREWGYERYSKRSVWVDVNGNSYRNKNEAEVKALIKELKHFEKFANHDGTRIWTVACLSFYRGQEKLLRTKLRDYTGQKNAYSRFKKGLLDIRLHTVDKFQGHEADIVFLSMVQTSRDGFLDSPNRLNVAITRARYQLVILGKYDYFARLQDKPKTGSEDLYNLASRTERFKS